MFASDMQWAKMLHIVPSIKNARAVFASILRNVSSLMTKSPPSWMACEQAVRMQLFHEPLRVHDVALVFVEKVRRAPQRFGFGAVELKQAITLGTTKPHVGFIDENARIAVFGTGLFFG